MPCQAPPFDRIRDADFAPSFEDALARHRAEIEAIANDPTPPTFETVLVALEQSGQALTRVMLVFDALVAANTNDRLQELQQAIAPTLAAHEDAIYLNTQLFARLDDLYERREQLNLDAESRRLLEHQHRKFVRAGARLGEADKARLKALNEEDAALKAAFQAKLLAAGNDGALVVENVADLDGLSQEDIDGAAETARARGLGGRWVLTLRNTTRQPLLTSLRNRSTRERLFNASITRTSLRDGNDTRATIVRLAQIRAERAALLGQPSHAAWRLQNQMAKTPDQVEAFLAQLVAPATARARREASDIEALMRAQGEQGRLEPWDWEFYAEQVRQARYNVSEADMAPYFELDRVVRDGVFFAAERLFGLSITERRELPVYHPDVRVFDVRDASRGQLGLLYVDFFTRDNKRGGAWMDNLALQSTLLATRPIVTNVFNFTKPLAGQPALLSLDDVITLFHEFGHALHGLFANQRFATLSGTAVPRDFVEFPSLLNEHWALDPEVLSNYARHHVTNEPMPAELVDRIRQAARFNQGYALTEVLSATRLDLEWHSLSATNSVSDVERFEQDALSRALLDLAAVPPRYYSGYFLHIWANGYDAGYYAYLWAEMLTRDAAAWLVEHGGLTRENGRRLRDLVLSRGNAIDSAEAFREFLGRDPVIGPMLAFRGLTA